jgi:hypothetical protein
MCGCTDENACYDEPTDQVCGWAGEDLCTFRATGGPPSFVWAGLGGEEEQVPDLGPCCGCEVTTLGACNIVMLDKKAPVAGAGWGCLVCELPHDGAVAVLCDACLLL